MELAPPYTLLSLFSLFYTVYAVNTSNCFTLLKQQICLYKLL